MAALGLFTGRPPVRKTQREPWTQEREVTSGGEPQWVRYHVALVEGVQHLVCQYRSTALRQAQGERVEWSSARQTLCDAARAFDLADSVVWGEGRWCAFCRDVLRAEMR